MSLTATTIEVGTTHQAVVVDNLTRTQIVQYASASGDYNPLHTDEVFATQVAGYPSVFAHGMLTMGMTGRMLTDYVGDGRLTEFGGRFTSQVWPGDTLTATATVTAVEERDGVLIADVVYDPVGGDAYQRSTKCIAFEGRILVIGFAGGQIQSAALNHALVKNYSIVGLHWGLYAKMNPALMRLPRRAVEARRGRGDQAPGERALGPRRGCRRSAATRGRHHGRQGGLCLVNPFAQLGRLERYAGQTTEQTASVDAAVFDYGGVLTTPVRDSIAAWLDRDTIDPASFSKAIKMWLARSAPDDTPIRRLEIGELSATEFNVLLAAELVGKDGGAVTPGDQLGSMFAEMRPEPVMFDLVQDLKNAGVRVALLSNSWGNTYPRERIDAVFDVVVISGEVSIRKPNPDIFAHALDLLDVRPERVVFIDDAEPNTDGAARLGMHTILHTDPDITRTKLARLVPTLETHI